MTAKEQAQYLYKRYRSLEIENNHPGLGGSHIEMAKDDAVECAIIAVEEILKLTDEYSIGEKTIGQALQAWYWKSVKEELQKM